VPARRGVGRGYLQTLVELLLMGAKDGPVPITTSELARRIGRSQQAASRQLELLEGAGLVERYRRGRSTEVKLTPQGVNELVGLYLVLRSVLEEPPESYLFTGTVFSGIGEGRYYMSLEGYRSQFARKLGFEPYPGTLNVRLDSPSQRMQFRELIARGGIRVSGFSDGVRTYGAVTCYRALIEDVAGAVVVAERTHYDYTVMELIAQVSLREALGLRDGDRVSVRVFSEGQQRAEESRRHPN